MVRFAIRKHRCKAEKLYFLGKLSKFVYPWFWPSGVLELMWQMILLSWHPVFSLLTLRECSKRSAILTGAPIAKNQGDTNFKFSQIWVLKSRVQVLSNGMRGIPMLVNICVSYIVGTLLSSTFQWTCILWDTNVYSCSCNGRHWFSEEEIRLKVGGDQHPFSYFCQAQT